MTDLASLSQSATPECMAGSTKPSQCRDPSCDGKNLLTLTCTSGEKTVKRQVEVPCSEGSQLKFENGELFCGKESGCVLGNRFEFPHLLCDDDFYPVVPHPDIFPDTTVCPKVDRYEEIKMACRQSPDTPCSNLRLPVYDSKYKNVREDLFDAIARAQIIYPSNGSDLDPDWGGPSNPGASSIVSECCPLTTAGQGEQIIIRVTNRHTFADLVVGCDKSPAGSPRCKIEGLSGQSLNYEGIEACKVATQAAAEELACSQKGLNYCNGACADLQIEWNNCGGCGHRCLPRSECENGHCGEPDPGL